MSRNIKNFQIIDRIKQKLMKYLWDRKFKCDFQKVFGYFVVWLGVNKVRHEIHNDNNNLVVFR